jgi:mannose-6-phosphate isomerase-like protein (cupin superfamily)
MIDQRKEKNMSTAEMTLLFQGRGSRGASGASDSTLRLVLLPGEVLRVPPTHGTLRVLSGTAWVSLEGEDVLLGRDDLIDIAHRADRPVVSGLGREPLFFEVC